MQSESHLPVYQAMVTDVVEWSGAGWCTVFLRFDPIVAHFPMEVLYATGDTDWAVGGQVSGTLHVVGYKISGAEPGRGIAYDINCDFDPFNNGYVEYPIAPSTSYALWGQVVSTMGVDFTMDCGLVVQVSPKSNLTSPEFHDGDYVRVVGELRIKLHHLD